MKLSLYHGIMDWTEVTDIKMQSKCAASTSASSVCGVHNSHTNHKERQVARIASTYSHVFATNSKSLWRVYARNTNGTEDWNVVQLQLPFDDGVFLSSNNQLQLADSTEICQIECGNAHCVLLDTNGRVYTFGCGR